MTPATSKKQRLDRWHTDPHNRTTLRAVLENPVVQEAFALAQAVGVPASIHLSADGQQTLVANALGQAQQVGWSNALLFLQRLAEAPPEKPQVLEPWGHLKLKDPTTESLQPDNQP